MSRASGWYARVPTPMLAFGLLVSYATHAAALPERTMLDDRVRTASYDPGQVYQLQAHVGYQIELELERGETLLGQGAGDLEGIAIAAFEHHVFLKPKAADVRTNLTLTTNRRTYRFDYVVVARATESVEQESMYVVRFVYPDAASPARSVDDAFAHARLQRALNVDYWYCGDASIRPLAAWDDGVHTRLKFDMHVELPAIFVRSDDGTESLLNFSVDDEGDIIVHRVARTFVVRRGRLAGCIVNQGFVGIGDRLNSGTVAPDVIRERKEPVR